jgi:formyl-CoA transferase
MRVGIPVADLTAGLFCAIGIMVALLERETSGKGQAIDTSLLQAQLFMLDFQASRWTMSGEVPGQAGNNHPTSIPTGVFKTSDGYINIAATGQKMWTKICELIGEPQMANDPKYNSGAARLKNRDALNEVLESHTVKRTSAEWVDALNKAGVPCGPIYSVDQAFGDAQVKHLGIARGVRNQEQKMIHLVGQPGLALAHPERHRGGDTAPRRAYRRSLGRIRIQQGRHQQAARGKNSLVHDPEKWVPVFG